MNLKISLYVLVSFLIAFSIFSYVMFLPSSTIKAEIPLPVNMENYLAVQQDFFSNVDLQEKNIFILGSSYIMALNTTQIHDQLLLNGSDYRVYNLAIFGDSIQKRSKTIDAIISAKPEIVVYGIAEDDFSDPAPTNTISTKPSSVLPNPHDLLDNGIASLEEGININYPDSPKTITWLNVRQILGTGTDSEKWNPYPDSPFMKITKANTVTISDLELKNLVNYVVSFGQIKKPQDNKHLQTLKEALVKLQENNIKVVLFVVPHHEYLLSKAPSEYKETFSLVIDDIRKQGLPLYNREQDYSDLTIWHDLTHIAVNEKSFVFSNDVAKMILAVME